MPAIPSGALTAYIEPPSGPRVVTKMVSRSLPPNVTDVGHFTGSSISWSTTPSRDTRITLEAPLMAIQGHPSASHCAPSGLPSMSDGSS